MIASKPLTSAKIAIITRTKNRTLLLKRAIESIEKQTYDDYVHVIVNDGGDKTDVEVLLSNYANKRRVVIHNPTSVGLTKALNQGIKAVASDYIAILDDDDSLHKDRLKLAVEYLDVNNKSYGVIHIMDRVIEEIHNNEIKELSRNRWHQGVRVVNLYKQLLDNYMSNGAFTYRRNAYNELNGYDEDLSVAEDWDFGVRFLLKYDVDFLNTGHVLSYYHHRPQQVGDSGNSVFSGITEHENALNKLQNKYLRNDINTGKFGIGYIMNNLRYEREQDEIIQQKVTANVVRLEGHMNFVANKIEKHLESNVHKIINASLLRKIRAKIKG